MDVKLLSSFLLRFLLLEAKEKGYGGQDAGDRSESPLYLRWTSSFAIGSQRKVGPAFQATADKPADVVACASWHKLLGYEWPAMSEGTWPESNGPSRMNSAKIPIAVDNFREISHRQ